MRSVHIATLLLAGALFLQTGPANAEEYGENKPVRVVVVTAPGGAQDRVARLFAEKLRQKIKQPVTVENRPGGASRIAVDYARGQPADGYTILQHSTTFTFLPQYFPNANLNPTVDFVPVVALAETAVTIMVTKDSPHKTLGELVAGMKANPDAFNWGVSFIGSFDHLVGLDFLRRAGAKASFVGYKGEAPMTVDFLSGRTQIVSQGLAGFKSHIEAGTVRPLAITGVRRVPEMPNLPTVAEQGYPGYSAVVWYGWFVPAGTPKEVVLQLNKIMEEVKKDPDVIAKVSGFNNSVVNWDMNQFTEQVKQDSERWGMLVKDMGFKPQ